MSVIVSQNHYLNQIIDVHLLWLQGRRAFFHSFFSAAFYPSNSWQSVAVRDLQLLHQDVCVSSLGNLKKTKLHLRTMLCQSIFMLFTLLLQQASLIPTPPWLTLLPCNIHHFADLPTLRSIARYCLLRGPTSISYTRLQLSTFFFLVAYSIKRNSLCGHSSASLLVFYLYIN